jgi:hypothetical protein
LPHVVNIKSPKSGIYGSFKLVGKFGSLSLQEKPVLLQLFDQNTPLTADITLFCSFQLPFVTFCVTYQQESVLYGFVIKTRSPQHDDHYQFNQSWSISISHLIRQLFESCGLKDVFLD